MSSFPSTPIAHTTDDERTHNLLDHLQGTAKRCATFADAFDCAEWGQLLGLWHDLGKYSLAFQQYIRHADTDRRGRVDHSSVGAQLAITTFGARGRLVAYPIAGHHAGLADWMSERAGMGALAQRLEKRNSNDAALDASIPDSLVTLPFPTDRPPRPATSLTCSFWVRMLFSCLVDADYLDTEAFFDARKTYTRVGYPQLADLLPRFTRYMDEKQAVAHPSAVNELRASILQQCISRAAESPGFYTLTVPTGGGKTLSSLAFALHHALAHAKRRVIYVIPYTSIIEQTADQFREIVGESLIEHHSNFESPDETEASTRHRLACENWDAPIIVTTTVQFYESLFAARPSRCRKLHNIANSVVILDEAQLLPADFLAPVLEAMKELQRNYGVTVVLCTATQPALGAQHTQDFHFNGLGDATEIVSDVPSLFHQLRRTNIAMVHDLQQPVTWEELAAQLQTYDSMLCIVNRRDDARQLWQLMPKGTWHLSALMCGAHRSRRIAEIKQRLRDGLPTRVISTQLVEAGVDLDFPVVYRAVAGLDSIAQAAGRCNREGRLTRGQVFVFQPPSEVPVGYLRQAAGVGRRLLLEDADDPLAPERFTAFFRELYWLHGDRLDKQKILELLGNDPELRISFREAAHRFKLIDDATQAPVLVRYDNADLLGMLEHGKPDRWLLRKLQRSVVNLSRWTLDPLLASGAVREVHPGILMQMHSAYYHDDLGFCPDQSAIYAVDTLIW